MLTELSLSNFKSWKQITQMRLAPITGLFGSNSSGKTSLLQLLLMLKQTVESPDRAQVLNFGDDRSPTNLGSFHDVVHAHQKPGVMDLSLSWKLPQSLRISDPEARKAILFEGDALGFEAHIAENGAGRLVVDRMSYAFSGQRFTMRRKGEGEAKFELQEEGGQFRFIRTQGRPWDLPAPIKFYGFPDQVKAYFQNAGFLADLQLALEELFAQVYYLGPLREYPQRQYTWAGAEPADMGRRGERVVDALLAARERGVKISRGRGRDRLSLEAYVAYWLKELGLIHDFSVEAIARESNLYRVWVQKTPTTAKVLVTDVGFGVSQILPVLAICYYVPEGSTILLEQPEIHLHPSVQAGLADVFLDAVRTRHVQIIFESHSEHLLRRLQRRVAEDEANEIAPNAALYFCEIADGASALTHLKLNLFGNIENWPKDFFGDEFSEMAATTKAAMARKSQQG
jgi:predicted ATPase